MTFRYGLSRLMLASSMMMTVNTWANTDYRVIADADNVCWNGPVEISGKVSMNPDCRAVGSVLIKKSGTNLDCNGAIITINKKKTSGINVDSEGHPLSDVEIRGCTIEKATWQGIYIGWNISDREKEERHSKDELYKLTPQNVTVIDSKIINPLRSGIFIDDYVSNAKIIDNQISGAGGVGIYLNFNSTGTLVRGNLISGAGRISNREGLAIDASQENRIIENKFLNNKNGGIFVYRNCSERVGISKNQVMRRTSADQNLIARNTIKDSGRGIWIASRQSRDLSRMQCGNGYYADGKYTLDSAKSNMIINNVIKGGVIGITIEDDFNEVVGNSISGARKASILIGTEIRNKVLGKPVTGTKLENNVTDGGKGNIQFEYGSYPK